MRRLIKYDDLCRGMVILIVLWCSACANGQARQTPTQHIDMSYDRPTNVDIEPVRLVSRSRYRQPRMAHDYLYDHTETDLAIPLPPSRPGR